jgi:hypothetical protein
MPAFQLKCAYHTPLPAIRLFNPTDSTECYFIGKGTLFNMFKYGVGASTISRVYQRNMGLLQAGMVDDAL